MSKNSVLSFVGEEIHTDNLDHVSPSSAERKKYFLGKVRLNAHDKMVRLLTNSTAQVLASRLDAHLAFAQDLLRDHQAETFEKLSQFLRDFAEGRRHGRLTGLIKHPTGAGKTRLFCEIASALDVKSLILVPRVSLIAQTCKTLYDVGFTNGEVASLIVQPGTTALSEWRHIQNESSKVLVMTYQSLLSLWRSIEGELYEYFASLGYLVSDEGHRSLGATTTEVTENLIESTNTLSEDMLLTQEELDAAFEVESLLKNEDLSLLHLFFTATPQLAQKEVQNVYSLDTIDALRVQDMVVQDVLVLPTRKSLGTAIASSDSDHITNRGVEACAENDLFMLENGVRIGDAMLSSYDQLCKEHGKLPGVIFCANIAQAEYWKNVAVHEWGYACARSTSANAEFDAGMDPSKAEELLASGDLDLVFTVSKVGEGWDVPCLRVAGWLTPVGSPARYLQGVGRIMRSFPGKTSENTFVLEPEWQVLRRSPVERVDDLNTTPKDHFGHTADITLDEATTEPSSPRRWRGGHSEKPLYTANTLYDWLVLTGEMDASYLQHTVGYVTPAQIRSVDQWCDYFQSTLQISEWENMSNREAGSKFTNRHGISMYRLAKILNVPGDPVGYVNVRLAVGKKIWPDANLIPKKMTSVEGLIKYFRSKYTPEQWVKMNTKDAGPAFTAQHDVSMEWLSKKFGITPTLSLTKNSRLQIGLRIWPGSEAMKQAVDESMKEIKRKEKQQIETRERSADEWIQYFRGTMSPEQWKRMKKFDTYAHFTKTHSICIRTLAKMLGVDGRPDVNCVDRCRLGKRIWPESTIFDVHIASQKTPEEWIEYFQIVTTPSQWKSFTQREFGIVFTQKHGISLYSLAIKLGLPGSARGTRAGQLAIARRIFPQSRVLQ